MLGLWGSGLTGNGVHGLRGSETLVEKELERQKEPF